MMIQVKAAILGAILSCAVAVSSTASPAPPGAPPPSSCTLAREKQVPIPMVPGREVVCAIDIGSKNAKLVVLSMERGRPSTIRDERQCRRRLDLGARVFDAGTGARRALADDGVGYLVETVREFQGICRIDGGRMVGADATQWARDAPNMDSVRSRLAKATGIEVDVLNPTQEGVYSYLAGARGRPGRLVLDPGSNSLQLSWQVVGDREPRTVSVPLGYVRAVAAHMADAPDFATALRAYRSDLEGRLRDALGKVEPPTSLESLHQAVTDGSLSPDLLVVGADGAVHLIVRGAMRDGRGAWLADKARVEARVKAEKPIVDPVYGLVSGLLKPAEIRSYLAVITPTDFATLRSDPVRELYGDKALVVPALLDLLATKLGLERLVLTPQEMPTGYVLSRLR